MRTDPRARKFVVAATLWLALCLGARADQSVSLAWDQSPDTNVVGYAVYYGNSSGAYDSRLDVGTNTVATVAVPGGLTYFFVATSYDADGLESEPSNEVSYSVPGVVDLSITMSAAPPVLNVGSNVTYTIQITNAGPDTAGSVTVSNVLPLGEIFVDAVATQGTIADANGIVTFDLGPVPSGAQATLTVIANAISAGALTDTATVSTTTGELNLSDNSASALVSVTANAGAPKPIDFSVNELTVLTFTNSAGLNLPPGFLVFGLSNAPAGAAIDLFSGVFTWTPTEFQGPSTNFITVVITDADPLSAFYVSKTFTVVVNELNSPPVLPAQTNRTITCPAALLVTNTASDSDIPANTLTYQLINSPAGAAIDTNGIIIWTPSPAQVPSTNVITTVVTDYNPWAVNAQSLSATNSFTVIVLGTNSAPSFQSIRRAGGTLLLTFSATIGQKYQLQYKSGLIGTNWNNLGSAFTATNPSATVSDVIGLDRQRFYRVVLLP